jgi:hypothetical protein
MASSLRIIWFILFLILQACNSSDDGTGGFAGLDQEPPASTTPPASGETTVAVEITEFTPTTDPVIVLSSGTQVFGVSVVQGSGNVSYQFLFNNVLVQSSTSPFYTLNAGIIAAGVHTLRVVATNSLGSDEKIFNIRKNTPPVVSLTANTPISVACGVGTFELQVSAFDADNDNMTYQFLLNGATNAALLTGTNTATTATVVFTPTCAVNGLNTIAVRATDVNGESGLYSINVTVTNPNTASIDSFSPLDNPRIVLSTQNQLFTISASGNPPLSYQWSINPGGVIATCTTASCMINQGSFSPGVYTLTATVTDALTTTDSHIFNVVFNGAPTVTTVAPTNAERFKMDCSTAKNFQVNFTDANYPTSPSQTYSVQWTINGNPSDSIGHVTDTSSSPMNSVATFTPNCAQALLGNLTLRATISDGFEQNFAEWEIQTNYFSDVCNSLAPNRICTLAGMPGMMNYQLPADANLVRIRPLQIRPFQNIGYIIVDDFYRSLWFYNTSGATQTVLGTSVNAQQVKIVAGTGASGDGVNNQSALNFSFRRPWDVAVSSTGEVYVADQGRNNIIKFTSAGIGSVFAGGGAGSTNGSARTAHACINPQGLALDEANDRLFVACYNNNNTSGGVKSFSLANDEGYFLIQGGGNNNAVGTIGTATPKISRGAYHLVKDPHRAVLYVSDYYRCQIMAVNYGEAAGVSYYGGAVTVALNQVERLTHSSLNATTCGDTATARAWNAAGTRFRIRFLSPFSEGGETKGLFFSDIDRHHVIFLNFTTSSISLGGRSVPAGQHNIVYGVYNSAGDLRGVPAHLSSQLRNPYGLHHDSAAQRLLISDFGNYKIASLRTNLANGASEDWLGSRSIYDGEANKPAQERLFYNPRGLTYSESSDKLWIIDDGNNRIRSVDLRSGIVTNEVGTGAVGAGNINPSEPLSTLTRTISGVYVSPDRDELIYTDLEGGGNNQNQNCLIRSLNLSGTDQDYWGQLIPANRLSTVVGSYLRGCGAWGVAPNDAPVNGDDATTKRMDDPYGVFALEDNSRLYFTMRRRHLVMSVNEDGQLRYEIGTYNTTGNATGLLTGATLDHPGDLIPDSDTTLRTAGNYFIIDRSLATNSRIKYVNLSGATVEVAGIEIASNSIEIIRSDDYIASLAVFDDQICYTRGRGTANTFQFVHGVICLDRSTAATKLIGVPEVAAVKGGLPINLDSEGNLSSSYRLREPYGITFDSSGNLYIADFQSIKMVRRWW